MKEKWNNLSEEDKNKFAPLSPDFIIEVRSKSDHLEDLKKKMEVWIKSGVQLAWLIDPVDKMSFIFRQDGSIQKLEGFDGKIKGEKPVEGFELDLVVLTS